MGGRPRRWPSAAACTRQSPAAAHTGLATARLRHPGRAAWVPAWIEGPYHFPADQEGRLRTDRMYLIRPDGYVAASLPTHSGHLNDADLQETLAAHQLRN